MDGLKQRIIGALVLVSLAVIFVPMFFDEPHDERTTRSLDIPEEPPFPEVDIPEPDGPAPASDTSSDYRIEEVPSAEAGDTVAADPSPSVPQPVADNDAAKQQAPAGDGAGQSGGGESVAIAGTDGDAAGETAPASRPEGAWVLQLGSFGNADNARKLRSNVRDRGYNAHLQEVTRGGTTLVRVFSGPFADKTEAERAKAVLDPAFGVNALVTRGDDDGDGTP